MNQQVPHIFDRNLRLKRLRRAHSQLTAPPKADFLLRRIANDMNERLLDVTRDFDKALIITPLASVLDEMPALYAKVRELVVAGCVDVPKVGDVLKNFDEENPALKPQTYDLIISMGNLHVVNDLPGALIQLRTALKPDGLLLAGFAGGETLSELRQSFMQAETELENGVSPRVHPFGDLRELGALLQRAGLALPVADSDSLTVRYHSPLALLQDLRRMGETNILHDRRRTFLRRATLMRAMQIYQEKFASEDGKIPSRFDLFYLAGWSPHESQQKPLKRGSAKMRLSDALGVAEQKLKP